MLLELAAGLTHPALPALGTRNDPLLVKHQLRLGQSLTGRLSVLGLLAPQLLPSLAEELTAPLGCLQLLGELITTRVSEQLVLGLVGRPVLSQDLPGDLPKIAGRVRVRRPRHPRAVDRDHLRLRPPRLTTQAQHLAEQVSQRLFVPNHEP